MPLIAHRHPIHLYNQTCHRADSLTVGPPSEARCSRGAHDRLTRKAPVACSAIAPEQADADPEGSPALTVSASREHENPSTSNHH